MLKKQPLNLIAATLRGCAAFFFLLAIPAILSCTKPSPEVCINSVCFAVEVAQTPETREKGLMFRKSLAPNAGMIFVFPKDNYYAFWMKNTPLSLDILWISSQDKIVHIEESTTPYSLKHLESPYPCRYVLELNAGSAKKHRFQKGMQVSLPKGIDTL